MSGDVELQPITAFGTVLPKHRRAAGLSQEKLGLESGVQRNFISLIETGQNQPTINTIFRLAEALRIRPSTLIQDTEKLLGNSAK
jgi:transcriptional regulator with XRE-family HTH domain